jgi:hypothetical protein
VLDFGSARRPAPTRRSRWRKAGSNDKSEAPDQPSKRGGGLLDTRYHRTTCLLSWTGGFRQTRTALEPSPYKSHSACTRLFFRLWAQHPIPPDYNSTTEHPTSHIGALTIFLFCQHCVDDPIRLATPGYSGAHTLYGAPSHLLAKTYQSLFRHRTIEVASRSTQARRSFHRSRLICRHQAGTTFSTRITT